MKKTILGLGLAFSVTLGGCDWLKNLKHRGYNDSMTEVTDKPKVENLLAFLNDNARRVDAVRCTDLAIDGKFDGQRGGVSGKLFFQKPLDLRLKASAVGQQVVDIGSNSKEFWFWMGRADPHVFFVSYEDFRTKNIALPFPFQPEMIIAAFGIAEYDPDPNKYELKVEGKTLELIQRATSAQGQPVQRVTVFDRMTAAPGKPQVIAHILRDLNGKEISSVKITEVVRDPKTNATLPKRAHLSWPAEKVEMTMRFGDIESTTFTPDEAGAFSRADLNRLKSINLATRREE